MNMDYGILDLIYECYTDYYYPDLYFSEKEREFDNMFIKPLAKENYEKGAKIEEMFSETLIEIRKDAFKNGFKACMRLMAECMD